MDTVRARRTMVAAVLGTVLILASCGGSGDGADTAESADEIPTVTPGDTSIDDSKAAEIGDPSPEHRQDTAGAGEVDTTLTSPGTSPVPDTRNEDGDDAAAPAEPTTDDSPSSETPDAAAQTSPRTSPETDTTVPDPAPVGGRQLGEALDPASGFDGNPLPDIVVDDVGNDAKVNVANILPAQRPVLVWAWAPH